MTRNVYDLVKVKPLEWEGGAAISPFGTYTVHQSFTGKSWYAILRGAGVGKAYEKTEDAAKSAAQADYESRILAALTPAEQCFSVKEGYGAVADDPMGMAVPLADALTIRSAEEVRREAVEGIINEAVGMADDESERQYIEKRLCRCLETIDTPAPCTDTHPDDEAVDRFAVAMKAKLAKKRADGRGGWEGPECSADFLSQFLREHIEKGDPVDVGNLAMMIHQRGERITPSTDTTPSVAEADNRVESICRELRNAGYMVPVSVMDRALAAQTGGE